MPTLITHGAIGLISGAASPQLGRGRRFWLFALLCPLLPDADVIAFKLGIPYSHVLGHRGFSHSLLFALLVGIAAGIVYSWSSNASSSRRTLLACFFFSLLTASHGLLDACTNGGLGVALLAPFSNERFFFAARPIKVSAIGLTSFFKARSLSVLGSELLWVWLPASLAALGWRLSAFVMARRRQPLTHAGGPSQAQRPLRRAGQQTDR